MQTSTNISIRIRARQKDLIDRAAERQGRSRSEFMLAAACREAEDVLCDQVFFPLEGEAFAKFRDMLDHPPEPNDRLRRLMATKAPWE